jgi:hypothetical protein
MDHRETASLLARIGNRPVGEVNILCFQVRDVGLGPAQMPAQFVKAPSLRVSFTSNDEEMFVHGDRSFGLVADFRPEAFRNERPGKPVHRETKVVKFPQMNVSADRSRLETGEKLLRLSLDNDTVANQVQCRLLCGTAPAILS